MIHVGGNGEYVAMAWAVCALTATEERTIHDIGNANAVFQRNREHE